jgi:hypothetical protein
MGRGAGAARDRTGGTTAPCSANPEPVAVNGACGSSNGAQLTGAPSANLCNAGTASSVSGSGPWSWSCAGSNGGNAVSCQASLEVPLPVNGVCGSAGGTTVSSAPSGSALCSAGTASGVSGSGPWGWSCAGSNGGNTVSCAAQLLSVPVNGACGQYSKAQYGDLHLSSR